MGKKSVKENKNIYHLMREEQNLTREQASELMETISADRIEKIENERSYPHPDEILLMADAYKAPQLCNYYCSHECPIGQEYVPEVSVKELSQIVLQMVSKLNSMNREKDRLIDIASDGEISADEYNDFATIQKQLSEMSMSIESFRIWVDKTIAEGKIDKSILKS